MSKRIQSQVKGIIYSYTFRATTPSDTLLLLQAFQSSQALLEHRHHFHTSLKRGMYDYGAYRK